MKLGISIKIDVTKIDKSRLFQGQKGTYLDLTTFIDTNNPSNYGDHGFISQSVSKDERAQGVQTPILGNTKIFYGLPQENRGYQPQQNQGQQQGYQNSTDPAPTGPVGSDDIPF